MKKNWNLDDISSQAGKIILITGANDGLGLLMTQAFTAKDADTIIMACRDLHKAEVARKKVIYSNPHTKLHMVKLDLGDLQSVRTCADEILKHYDKLDIIMANAGIMAVPYSLTKDGLEMQMGVNYYGHYALLGHLMPLIQKSAKARIVTTTSSAEIMGRLKFNAPMKRENYGRWWAYGDSKLAMLMLALILDEKFKMHGIDAMALSAHPGFAKTNLRNTTLKTERNYLQRFQLKFYESISMSGERGVLPLLYAATDPEAKGGQYIGVRWITRGNPVITKGQRRAYDPLLQTKLWEKSERLTNVSYHFKI